MQKDSQDLLTSTAIFASAGLLFANVWNEWELPWPVIVFLVAVAIVCACIEGPGNHPNHD